MQVTRHLVGGIVYRESRIYLTSFPGCLTVDFGWRTFEVRRSMSDMQPPPLTLQENNQLYRVVCTSVVRAAGTVPFPCDSYMYTCSHQIVRYRFVYIGVKIQKRSIDATQTLIVDSLSTETRRSNSRLHTSSRTHTQSITNEG